MENSTLLNSTLNNLTDVKEARNDIINISHNLFKDSNSFLFFLIIILVIALIVCKPWKI